MPFCGRAFGSTDMLGYFLTFSLEIDITGVCQGLEVTSLKQKPAIAAGLREGTDMLSYFMTFSLEICRFNLRMSSPPCPGRGFSTA